MNNLRPDRCAKALVAGAIAACSAGAAGGDVWLIIGAGLVGFNGAFWIPNAQP